MHIGAMMFCLALCALAKPAMAETKKWDCQTKVFETGAPVPETYDQVSGYIIAPRGEYQHARSKYKITQESESGLIAELPWAERGDMGLDVILLNKKTGLMRYIAMHANGWLESRDGKCVGR